MGIIRQGVHKPLEDLATQMILDDFRRRKITRHADKKDILTPWKQQARYRREVYPESGVADATIRKGIYHRAANRDKPELNSREGFSRPRSNREYSQGLAEHVVRDRRDDLYR